MTYEEMMKMAAMLLEQLRKDNPNDLRNEVPVFATGVE